MASRLTGWGASDFCWDSLPPKQLPPSASGYASGAASLSARLAARQQGQRSSAFDFQEAEEPAAAASTAVLPAKQAPTAKQRSRLGPAAQQQQQQHALPRPSGEQQPCEPSAAVAEVAPVGKQPAASVSAAMSLERYLEFRSHLTKGAGSRAQQLSELEWSVLKVNDLKQILLINGFVPGSCKTKADIIDKLRGMELLDPTGYVAEEGGTEGAPLAQGAQLVVPAAPAEPDSHMLESLEWLKLSPQQLKQVQQGVQTGQRSAHGYSCCRLPHVTIRFPPGAAQAAGAAVPLQQQAGAALPADSDLTVASGGRPASYALPDSAQPEEVDQVTASAKPEATIPVEQQLGAGSGSEAEGPAAAVDPLPAWVAEGVARISERSQGSAEQLGPQEMVGRKVAFVLVEDFTDGSDTVPAGVHEGQVVEQITDDPDAEPGSRWFYVRVRASGSGSTGGGSRQQRVRRLDLPQDLQQGHRAPSLEDLLGMGLAQLEDAWVLLEPRGEGEDAAPPASPVMQQGRQQVQRQQCGGQQEAVPPQRKRGGGRDVSSQPPPNKAARLSQQQQEQQQQQGCAAGAEALVWANVGGMWWPALLREGSLGGACPTPELLGVEVFGCNVALRLSPAKVTPFSEGRAARIAKQQAASDLGRKAVQRALRIEAGEGLGES